MLRVPLLDREQAFPRPHSDHLMFLIPPRSWTSRSGIPATPSNRCTIWGLRYRKKRDDFIYIKKKLLSVTYLQKCIQIKFIARWRITSCTHSSSNQHPDKEQTINRNPKTAYTPSQSLLPSCSLLVTLLAWPGFELHRPLDAIGSEPESLYKELIPVVDSLLGFWDEERKELCSFTFK